MAEQPEEKHLVEVFVAHVTGVPKEQCKPRLTGQPRKFHVSVTLDSKQMKTASVPTETDGPQLISWNTSNISMIASDQSSVITVKLFAEHTFRPAVCIGTFEQALSELFQGNGGERKVDSDLRPDRAPPTKISFSVKITKIDRPGAGADDTRQPGHSESRQSGWFSWLVG